MLQMTPRTRVHRMATRKPDPLFKHAGGLADLSSAMIVLAEEAPERMTCAQMVFFLLAGAADLAGRPTTFTEIYEAQGEAINRSLHSTYRQLLKPSRTFPKALGWLDRTENPADNREKLLKLTPKGRKVIAEVVAALTGEDV
jgi:hypothetical protein